MSRRIARRVGIRSDDLTNCVESVTHWFLLNGLQLNANKTEVIVFGTRQQLDPCQQYSSIQIFGADVKVSPCIKTLGVHLDATLSMDVQVSETVKVCNFHLCSLRHVRKCLTLDSAKRIACGLIAAKLDYCNSLLSGTSKGNIMKLQRVQNDLAGTCRSTKKVGIALGANVEGVALASHCPAHRL